MATHLVVMGVAGSGKTAFAEHLSVRLGWESAEGDDFHSPGNIARMSSGIALTDEDRWPWLEAIASWIDEQDRAGHSTVVTCSALRRTYRERLREVSAQVFFIYLRGSKETLTERMMSREGHFMPTSLLGSQLATLEPLEPDEPGIELDVTADIPTLVEQTISRLDLDAPHTA